jgi:hypothetical protein
MELFPQSATRADPSPTAHQYDIAEQIGGNGQSIKALFVMLWPNAPQQ